MYCCGLPISIEATAAATKAFPHWIHVFHIP